MNGIASRRSVRWLLIPVAVIVAIGAVSYVVMSRAASRDDMVEFVVNTNGDDYADMGPLSCTGRDGQLCTLRGAIEESNEDDRPNRISFDLPDGEDTITLMQSSPLTIEDDVDELDLVIAAPEGLEVIGDGYAAVFDIAGLESTYVGQPDLKPDVEISGLEISGGNSQTGAGITNDFGFLTLRDVYIHDNAAENAGGGLHNYMGDVTVENSRISGNSSGGVGAGIVNQGGQMTLRGTSVSDNGSRSSGAGIYNDASGVLFVYDGKVSGNTARSDDSSGGGVFSAGELVLGEVEVSENGAGYGGGFSSYGAASVSVSTVAGNSARLGGGIETTGALTLDSSTVSGNSAERGGGIYNSSSTSESGGTGIFTSTIFGNEGSSGIFNARGDLTVTNTTVTRNEGGILTSADPFTSTTFYRSIVAGNDGEDSELVFGEDGSVTSGGYNLFGTVDFTAERTDRSGLSGEEAFGAPPELSDNRGPTQTVPLSEGSPAIDAVTGTEICQNPGTAAETDQRGALFTSTGGEFRCDIGAFEYGRGPADLSVTLDGPVEGKLDEGLNYTATISNAPAAGPATSAALTLVSDVNIAADPSEYPLDCGGPFCRIREFFDDEEELPVLYPTVPATGNCNVLVDVTCYADLDPGESYTAEITLTTVDGSRPGTFSLGAAANTPNSYESDESKRLRIELAKP